MKWNRANKAIALTLFVYLPALFLAKITLGNYVVFVGMALEVLLLIIIWKGIVGYSFQDVGLSRNLEFKKHVGLPISLSLIIYFLILISNGFNISVTHSLIGYLTLFTYYTLYVGLFEELLFRGLFFSALEEKIKIWAIPLSAIVFAILHNNIIFPLVWGLFAAAYMYKYRNIIGLVIAHGLLDTLGKTLGQSTFNFWLYTTLLAIYAVAVTYFLAIYKK